MPIKGRIKIGRKTDVTKTVKVRSKSFVGDQKYTVVK